MEDNKPDQIADQTEIPVSEISSGQKKSGIRASFVILIPVLLVLIIVAVAAWYFTFRSSENPLLATVAGEKLYKGTVEEIAKEQYLPSAIDSTVTKLFLDIAVEREILDSEAKRLGIVIPPAESKQQYYDTLKKKITAVSIESVSAYEISFWVPPPADYPQTPEYEEIRQTGKIALDEAEEKLKNKEDPLLVTQILYSRYPILQPILALNGYLIKSKVDDSVFGEPRTYVYDKRNEGQEFYDTLFSLQKGELKKSIWTDGSGGAVIQVISVNSGSGLDYEQWLAGKKKELVKYNQTAANSL